MIRTNWWFQKFNFLCNELQLNMPKNCRIISRDIFWNFDLFLCFWFFYPDLNVSMLAKQTYRFYNGFLIPNRNIHFLCYPLLLKSILHFFLSIHWFTANRDISNLLLYAFFGNSWICTYFTMFIYHRNAIFTILC